MTPRPSDAAPADATPATDAAKPLRLIGLGLLMLLILPNYRGWDLLPDWLGWTLVLIGSAVFTRTMTSNRPLLWAAVGAIISAAVLWPPEWNDAINDAPKSVLWAILLPRVAWSVLFCLACSARAWREPVSSVWWKYLAIMHIAVGVLPILVYGGGMTGLEDTLRTLDLLALICTMALAFWHSGRAWAVTPRDKG